MDPGVHRYMSWWGTALVALGLVFVGTFGYVLLSSDIAWYRTEVIDNRDIASLAIGEYVRVEGDVALNASEDVIITQVPVESTTWDWNDRIRMASIRFAPGSGRTQVFV